MVTSQFSGEKEVGDYALHLQCPWRLVSSEGILVASRDIYYPAGDPNDVPDGFDYDEIGANRFDAWTGQFLEHLPEGALIVEDVVVGREGSFALLMSSGYSLEVFPNDSLDHEYWRLFEPSKETPHFVVTGKGIH